MALSDFSDYLKNGGKSKGGEEPPASSPGMVMGGGMVEAAQAVLDAVKSGSAEELADALCAFACAHEIEHGKSGPKLAIEIG